MCSCEDRPKCEWHRCAEFAAWSVYQPAWTPRSERFKFMCDAHSKMYEEKIPGIDRPAHADEYWRPSLTDMMKLASINAAAASPPAKLAPVKYSRDDKYTPAQLAQIKLLRAYHAGQE